MMMQLSPELEDRLHEQELSPTSASDARRVLEEAIAFQFKSLADGLLAERLLREGQLPRAILSQHFETGDGDVACDVDKLARQFADSIVTGVKEPILIRDLPNVRIRIFGGATSLWDDSEINQQLRDLGSDVRLAFPGAARLAAAVMMDLLGHTDDDWPIDSRFIVGRVGTKTFAPFGPVFNFYSELAVSPHVDPSATGFSYENKAVIRRPAMHRMLRARREQAPISREQLELQCIHVLGHELLHTAAYHHPTQQPYLPWYYLQDLVADICRYTMNPKTRQDIEAAFDLTFERMIVAQKADALGRAIPESELIEAMQMVPTLLQEGKISFNEVTYHSNIYGENSAWAF